MFRASTFLRYYSNKSRYVLALDVNSKKTGFCVLQDDSVIKAGVFSTNSFSNIFDKADGIKSSLVQLKKEIESEKGSGEWTVAVEDNLQSFSGFRTNNVTLFTLAKLNALVCYGCR